MPKNCHRPPAGAVKDEYAAIFRAANMADNLVPTHEFEAFYIAVSLQLGVSPVPTYGIDRISLCNQVAKFMSDHAGVPDAVREVDEQYAKKGWKDRSWRIGFYRALADTYLDWLYKQPESKAQAVEAAQKYVDHTRGLIRHNKKEFWSV